MDNKRKLIPVTGWGRTICAIPKKVTENFQDVLNFGQDRGALPIGNLRSYGDTAISSNGILIKSVLNREIKFELKEKIVICGSGVTIGELSRAAISHGLYPRVVPGTEFVTIGGAIAADIHGKSHHLVGSFSEQLLRIRIRLADGSERDLFPTGTTGDWFWATCGGLGLTGQILEAEIELQQIQSKYIRVSNFKFQNLYELRGLVEATDSENYYSVAWLDLSGSFIGRGILSLGRHAQLDELPIGLRRNVLISKPPIQIGIPFTKIPNLIRPFTVRIFNEFWFKKPKSGKFVEVRKFMHPLDGVGNWNRLYGAAGFIQYQFVIPDENFSFLNEVLQLLKESHIASPLCVLKKLGPASPSFLGFAKTGWTLSIDIPRRTRGLSSLLNNLTEQIVPMGGRVYLAKDSMLSSNSLEAMYTKLAKWREIKLEMDPNKTWISDQSRRLRL